MKGVSLGFCLTANSVLQLLKVAGSLLSSFLLRGLLMSVSSMNRIQPPVSSSLFARREAAPISSAQAVQMMIKEINMNEAEKG